MQIIQITLRLSGSLSNGKVIVSIDSIVVCRDSLSLFIYMSLK